MKIKIEFTVPDDEDYGRIVMAIDDALPDSAENFQHDSED